MKISDGPATVKRIIYNSQSQVTCAVRLGLILRAMETDFVLKYKAYCLQPRVGCFFIGLKNPWQNNAYCIG